MLYCDRCHKPIGDYDDALLTVDDSYYHKSCKVLGSPTIYHRATIELEFMPSKDSAARVKQIKEDLIKYGCKVLYISSDSVRIIYPNELPEVLCKYSERTSDHVDLKGTTGIRSEIMESLPDEWPVGRRFPSDIFKLNRKRLFPSMPMPMIPIFRKKESIKEEAPEVKSKKKIKRVRRKK